MPTIPASPEELAKIAERKLQEQKIRELERSIMESESTFNRNIARCEAMLEDLTLQENAALSSVNSGCDSVDAEKRRLQIELKKAQAQVEALQNALRNYTVVKPPQERLDDIRAKKAKLRKDIKGFREDLKKIRRGKNAIKKMKELQKIMRLQPHLLERD